MSLAFFQDGLADTALMPTSCPVLHNESAPAFLHDWKSAQRRSIDQRFGYHYPAQELRVRTSIESAPALKG